jgi:FkbM family methyltransferase
MSHFKLEWIEKYLEKKPSVIFDIGSYDGKFGIKVKQCYKETRIICVEADKNLFNKMKLNKKLDEIEIFNYAVCDSDGEVDFYHNVGEKKGSGSINKPTDKIYKFPGMKFSEPIKVSSITLNSFCKLIGVQCVDILHMDVQSSEFEVLCGLGDIRPKLIFLEVSALNFYENTKSTRGKLLDMGYENIDISEVTKGDELWLLKK